MSKVDTQAIESPYTIAQAAELIGKSVWSVRAYIRDGKLTRIGSERSGLISAASLRAFLNGSATEGGDNGNE